MDGMRGFFSVFFSVFFLLFFCFLEKDNNGAFQRCLSVRKAETGPSAFERWIRKEVLMIIDMGERALCFTEPEN